MPTMEHTQQFVSNGRVKRMNRITRHAPAALLLLAAIAMAIHGPIFQPEGYHAFADNRPLLGLPNAADVLSNAGFLLVALWGLYRLRNGEARKSLGNSYAGYLLFLIGLLLAT